VDADLDTLANELLLLERVSPGCHVRRTAGGGSDSHETDGQIQRSPVVEGRRSAGACSFESSRWVRNDTVL
jgi:hypothetical protein